MSNYFSRFLSIVFVGWMSIFWSSVVYPEKSYSPYAEKTYPNNVYWGDTHLHTNLSVDAYLSKNTMLGLDNAYRFAKGQAVITANGMKAQLHRPLDFLVIADHAENLGILTGLQTADPILLKTALGKQLYDEWQTIQANPDTKSKEEETLKFGLTKLFPVFGTSLEIKRSPRVSAGFGRSIWRHYTTSADEHNEPEKFTAFIGYEWSSQGTGSYGNIHRVVLFKDGADKTDKILPFSFLDSKDPEELWQFMKEYQDTTGGKVLAIPHNGNISMGEMFSLVDFKGRPLTLDYAKSRSRWEPIYEVTQIKGDSEAHPVLSPADEFSDYETWNDAGRNTKEIGLVLVDKIGWVKQKKSEYARSALKRGLNLRATLGVNPFKFGMIGSTDSHTSLSAVKENNFWGKIPALGPGPERNLKKLWGWNQAASGYAAVWAEENTRESLFSSMKRKEVYASTGPRIKIRFFGGWEYEAEDALLPEIAEIGYGKGVPMGGDLVGIVGSEKAPSFLIRAVKDPDGANLDRVQVIKGWRDNKGELYEKVFNVALSDDREKNHNGKIDPVGNSVDVINASYTNSIGDPELSVVWKDPDFDKDEYAFYYVRVLEIPTPRWTAYDAKFFELKDISEEVPMITQERAYTSPIWYSPPAKAGGE